MDKKVSSVPQMGGISTMRKPSPKARPMTPTSGSPAQGTCTSKRSLVTFGCDKQQALYPGELRAVGTENCLWKYLHTVSLCSKAQHWERRKAGEKLDFSLKGTMRKLTHNGSQCRNSSLKSTRVICEGDILTYFRAYARRICWSSLWKQRHWWVPFCFSFLHLAVQY